MKKLEQLRQLLLWYQYGKEHHLTLTLARQKSRQYSDSSADEHPYLLSIKAHQTNAIFTPPICSLRFWQSKNGGSLN